MGLFKKIRKNKNPENLQESKKSQLKTENSNISICSCGCELSGQEHFCPKCGESVEINKEKKEETNFVQIKAVKTIEEIYKEKKRQLKIERANLDREWTQFNQNTNISAIETELAKIQQKIENIKIINKKRWRRIIVVWGFAVMITVGYIGFLYIKYNQEITNYREQQEAEYTQYVADTESQKQELEKQIEELTQELKK